MKSGKVWVWFIKLWARVIKLWARFTWSWIRLFRSVTYSTVIIFATDFDPRPETYADSLPINVLKLDLFWQKNIINQPLYIWFLIFFFKHISVHYFSYICINKHHVILYCNIIEDTNAVQLPLELLVASCLLHNWWREWDGSRDAAK